jgi:hypothetical protein
MYCVLENLVYRMCDDSWPVVDFGFGGSLVYVKCLLVI